MKECKHCGKVINESGKYYNTKIYCCLACRNKDYSCKNVIIVKNTKNMGTYSELIICCNLLKQGFDVFRSVSPYAGFDLVAHKNGELIKIEVKTGYINKNRLIYSLPFNNNYDIIGIFVKTDLSVKYIDKNKKTVVNLDQIKK